MYYCVLLTYGRMDLARIFRVVNEIVPEQPRRRSLERPTESSSVFLSITFLVFSKIDSPQSWNVNSIHWKEGSSDIGVRMITGYASIDLLRPPNIVNMSFRHI